MRGLLIHMTPLAPDQAGVVSVLFALGGLIVLVDAGGCTGNICGFDEPRWRTHPCALFSAGLRDMDAILGRDDRLIAKTEEAAKHLHPAFIALVGTPVPAVIGTDLAGIASVLEKRCRIPSFAIATTGTGLYDAGASAAYTTVLKRFAKTTTPKEPQSLGVFGATPLDVGTKQEAIKAHFLRQGYKRVRIHGEDGLSSFTEAAHVTENLVLAPAGLAAAQWMAEHCGIPYTIDYPLIENAIVEAASTRQTILCVHQTVLGQSYAKAIAQKNPQASILLASFCMTAPFASAIHLRDEEDLFTLVATQKIDCILGDTSLQALFDAKTLETIRWLDIPHYAVSSRL
ncbi:MAG: hypothetical protein IJS54_06340 [Desulfovibrio sp.]|nr:hypothetical protein [Desulfovibrio sp.]